MLVGISKDAELQGAKPIEKALNSAGLPRIVAKNADFDLPVIQLADSRIFGQAWVHPSFDH